MFRQSGAWRAILFGLAFATLGHSAYAQETLTPAIWIDPDGCEHWVIDDGAEGYMSPHLRRDGTPVCHARNLCGILETDVLFGFDSAVVTDAGRARLMNLLLASPARAYQFAGHTDDQGSDAYNLDLSQNRAEAVARLARSMGAPVADVLSYGERQPRASNQTERGRRENRRVEVLCLQ